jgi:hypothetical protein
MSVVFDIYDYFEFRSIIELGLNVHHSEIDFDKQIIFSWIREGIENGREHRVSTQGYRG